MDTREVNGTSGRTWVPAGHFMKRRRAYGRGGLPPFFLVVLMLTLSSSTLHSRSARSLIKKGNEAYAKEDYPEAEVEYRKAIEKGKGLVEGDYNLGGALYKQEKYNGSVQVFEDALSAARSNEMRARTLYNRGNALFKQKRYRESIDSYEEALRLNPRDQDAKHNLLLAMRMMKKQQEKKKEDKNNDKNKQPRSSKGKKQPDKKKGQGDQENKPQDRKQQGPKKEESKADQEKEEGAGRESAEKSQGKAGERKMSRAEAERILEALRNNEMDVQKKLRAKPAGSVPVEKDW